MKYSVGVLVATSIALTSCGGGSPQESPPPVEPADVSPVAVGATESGLPADWYRKGAFMEIFVRSYADSDGDGHGDINGLIGKLDYLQSMGIIGIWLMPVYPSYDHDHGYAIEDFRDIETAYGSTEDLKALLSEAHKRGIGVILDYAMDTSAATNPLFWDAKASRTSQYRDWYVWQDQKPGNWLINGKDPWYASSSGYYFSGYWDQLPDFNFRNPAVEAFHKDNMRFWLNLGVDGFRYDSASMLIENGPDAWYDQPETLAIISRVKASVNEYANRFTVCEAPFSPQSYIAPCGSAFGFDLAPYIIGASQGNNSNIQYVANYFKTASADVSTFLSNHDAVFGDRVYDQLNGNLAAYRMAAATYLTLPGVPFVYYGEEVGMANGVGLDFADKALRTPMSWSNDSKAGFTTGQPYRVLSPNKASFNATAEAADENSLQNFYKALLNLRKDHPALATGNYTGSSVDGKALHFQRRAESEQVWVALNYDTVAKALAATGLPANTRLVPLYPAAASELTTDAQGALNVNLPAQTLHIYQVQAQ